MTNKNNSNIDKKTQKALSKQKDGKKLSKKQQERVNLLNIKYRYKPNKVYNLRLKNVKRNFGSKKVLKGVSFDIEKGERVALLGKNGSGKSTLINVISQQIRMTSGDILYGYAKQRTESLEFLGIQFQTLNYPEGFVVRDVIHFFNASVEKSIRMSSREVKDLIINFGIDKFIDQKIDRLSGGQQQRVNILLALVKKPKLLILDEISTGLDVQSAEVIKSYIEMYMKKNPETSLLLVSHSHEEIREMTDKAYILEEGKIVEEFPSKELNHKKFLEITSREPKLTKAQKNEVEYNAKKNLRSISRRYNPSSPWNINFINKLNTKFNYIPNEKLSKENAVEIRDVSKTFNGKVGAVRQLSLDIKNGERVAITGPNGSGKTTIVEIIAKVKTYDKDSNRFKNQYSLIKNDYIRRVKEIEENILLELRRFKNEYELHNDLTLLEIKSLEDNLNQEVKKSRTRAAKKAENNATEEVKLAMKEAASNKRASVSKRIKNLQEELKNYLLIKENEYKKLEAKLNHNSLKEKALARLEYDVEFQRTRDLEKRMKENKNILYKKDYILDGEKIDSKESISDKPKLAYAFANTPREVKDGTGVQFQYASFPVEMSVQDVLLFFARTNKYFLTKEEMLDAIKVFKLDKLLKSKAYSLSGGERQRLNVLLAIMKSPKLLILDEISTGLDVDSILKIDKFIKTYLNKTNATLILISHNYSEVHSLTDKIIVMKYGELSEVANIKGWNLAKVKNKMRDIYKGGGL